MASNYDNEKHYIRARRELIRLATPEDLTPEEKKLIKAFYDYAKELNEYAEMKNLVDTFEVDHITPLSNKAGEGGLHHPDNLQVITKEQNKKKGQKDTKGKPETGAKIRDHIERWLTFRDTRWPNGVMKKGKTINPHGKAGKPKVQEEPMDPAILGMLDDLLASYKGDDSSSVFIRTKIELLKKSKTIEEVNKGLNDLQPLFAARKKDEEKEITDVQIHVVSHDKTMEDIIESIKNKNKY